MESTTEILDSSSTYVEILESFCGSLTANNNCLTVDSFSVKTNFSYQDILQRAQAAARHIVKFTQPGDRVLLVLPTSPEFVDYFFGCMISGRIAVPLPVEKTQSRFSRIAGVISDCDPALAIFKSQADFDKMKESVSSLPFLICEAMPHVSQDSSPSEKCQITPDHTVFIQYTSGSTGSPKGVVITHRNLVTNLRMIRDGMKITSNDRILSWLPLYHDMGLVGNFLTPMATGSHTYLYPHQAFAKNPIQYLELISEENISLTGAPMFAFSLLCQVSEKMRSDIDLGKLRLFYSGSERIQIEQIKHFYLTFGKYGLKPNSFFPCYGLAEGTLYVSGGFINPLDPKAENSQFEVYPSCGTFPSQLRVRIINEKGEDLPPGHIGQIQVTGDSISPGYWKDLKSDHSFGKIIEPKVKSLNTGDLGVIKNHSLYVTGRIKDLIKIRGRNIYPEDLEAEIEKMNDWFLPNSVFAISDPNSAQEEILILAEIKREKRKAPFHDLLNEIQIALSNFDLKARRIIILNPASLPKTSSGKKQRQAARKLLESGSFEINHEETYSSEISNENLNKIENQFDLFAKYFSKINLSLADERRSFPADLVNQAHTKGLLSLLVPATHGGQGLSHKQFAEIGAKLGALDVSLGSLIGNHNTIGLLPVIHSKVLSSKSQVLKNVVDQGSLIAFAMTEPSSGSDPRTIQSRVTPKDGKLLLSGEKVWIGNAPLAHYINVFAKEFDANGREIGISGFLLNRDEHDFQLGEEQLTVGLRPMLQARIMFSEVPLSEKDRLTEPGQGLELAFLSMEYARFGLAAMAVGAAEAALVKLNKFAKSRRIWTGSLFENSYFREKHLEMILKRNSLKHFVDQVASYQDRGERLPLNLSLVCKIIAGEWAFEIMDQCLQFCGGRGYTETFGLGRLWRDARIIRIFEGPTEAVAFQLGSQLLRNPASFNINKSFKVPHLNPNQIELIESVSTEYFERLPNEVLAIKLGIFAAEVLVWQTYLENLGAGSSDSTVVEAQLSKLVQNFKSDLQRSLVYSNVNTTSNFLISTDTQTERPLFDSWSGEYLPEPKTPELKKFQTYAVSSQAILKSVNTSNNNLKSDPIEEKLVEWMKSHTRIKVVDIKTPMSASGVDSLLAYELMCFIEDEFKISVPEELVTQRPSIETLTHFISSKIEQKNNETGFGTAG